MYRLISDGFEYRPRDGPVESFPDHSGHVPAVQPADPFSSVYVSQYPVHVILSVVRVLMYLSVTPAYPCDIEWLCDDAGQDRGETTQHEYVHVVVHTVIVEHVAYISEDLINAELYRRVRYVSHYRRVYPFVEPSVAVLTVYVSYVVHRVVAVYVRFYPRLYHIQRVR